MRHPDSFAAARSERLKASGNPSQYDDLDAFIRDQEIMQQLVRTSRLPTLVLDISDNNISMAVEKIADWMEQTGGLYMPD